MRACASDTLLQLPPGTYTPIARVDRARTRLKSDRKYRLKRGARAARATLERTRLSRRFTIDRAAAAAAALQTIANGPALMRAIVISETRAALNRPRTRAAAHFPRVPEKVYLDGGGRA